MGELLSYSIIGGLFMLALYLAYRLFLARDNQHGFNRSILLLIYVMSFLISPFCLSTTSIVGSSNLQYVAWEGSAVSGAEISVYSQPVWGTVLIWIYLVGMTVVAIRTITVWVRLSSVIRSGQKIERNGYTVVVTDNDRYAPFCWMRYIVMSRNDYEVNCLATATHEQMHIACLHWIDLLVAQIVCVINWFNPTAWLMRGELMLVHEYQADMAVIDSGYNPQEYQMLLIKKAVGARFPSLANSLNHSKLKKRITMMYKAKSGAGRKFKALALVPMLALALGLVKVPAVRAAVTTIGSSGISVDKGNENPHRDQIAVRLFKVTNINTDGIATTVSVKGENLGPSMTVSGGTFTNDDKIYRANSLQFNMTDGTASITAVFPFSGEYRHPSMTLTVNGEEIPFELEDFISNSQAIVIGNSPASKPLSLIMVNGASSSIPDNMDVYLDGEKISASQLKAISPDKIALVTVDRQDNSIKITSKK